MAVCSCQGCHSWDKWVPITGPHEWGYNTKFLSISICKSLCFNLDLEALYFEYGPSPAVTWAPREIVRHFWKFAEDHPTSVLGAWLEDEG